MRKKAIKYLMRLLKAMFRKAINAKKMTLHGVNVELTHDNISPELKYFFYNESYEAEEVTILSKYLSANDIVMEIGAGIGFLSTFAAKKIGSDKVFAYEANPFMIEKIKETYRLNSVKPAIKNVLLSDKNDVLEFFLERNFWSSSTLKRSENAQIVKVDAININEEIQNNAPTFLIIDIEGGEKDLIPMINFENSLVRKVIIEVHPHVISDTSISNVICNLVKQGFSLNLRSSIGNVLLFEYNEK